LRSRERLRRAEEGTSGKISFQFTLEAAQSRQDWNKKEKKGKGEKREKIEAGAAI